MKRFLVLVSALLWVAFAQGQDFKVETVRLGGEDGAPSVPRVLANHPA